MLYLILGMDARVVDILGAALECQPEVFGAQQYSRQRCRKHGFDGNGRSDYRGCGACGVELRRPMQAVSPLNSAPMAYFSFPFRRPAPCNPEAMTAGRFEPHNLLLERISGTVHQRRKQKQLVGKPYASPSGMPRTHRGQSRLLAFYTSDSRNTWRFSSPISTSSNSFLGLVLFDHLPGRNTDYEELLNAIPPLPAVPHYQSSPAELWKPKVYFGSKSSRRRFVRLAVCTNWTSYANNLREMPLGICLSLVLPEWTSIVTNTEQRLRELTQVTLPDDTHIAGMVKEGVYVRESLDMMQELLDLTKKGKARCSSKTAACASAETDPFVALEEDIQRLLSRTQDHVTRYDRQLAIAASLIAIAESRTSIRLAENIGQAHQPASEHQTFVSLLT